jgi:hypothetical protein
MRLKPVSIAPDLWQTDDYAPDKAAVHALIVGISSYPNLVGDKSLGMSQLAVSALTAVRFFQWLGTTYCHPDNPNIPIRARLLLSPTPEEQALFATMNVKISVGDQVGCTVRDPTLFAFRKGVQDWFTDAQQVKQNVADSRIVFFFSGHGLEINLDRQLLLPSDYSYTPATRMDMLSSENIRGGMAQLAISKQFYFFDACRSDVASMYDLASATGMEAVPESRQRNRALSAPVMRASVTGNSTYQPSKATSLDDLSFFGKALIDALELNSKAIPQFVPEQIAGRPNPAVTWYPLYQFVNRHVRQTILTFPQLPPPSTGPITIGNVSEDPLVLAIAVPAPPAPRPDVPIAQGPTVTGNFTSPTGARQIFSELESIESGVSTFEDIGAVARLGFLDAAKVVSRDVPDSGEKSGGEETQPEVDANGIQFTVFNPVNSDFQVEAYGSNIVQQLVEGTRAAAWRDNQWSVIDAPHPFQIHRVERTATGRLVRVHVLMDAFWHWLEFTSDSESPVTFAFLVPGTYDSDPPPYIALDFSVGGGILQNGKIVADPNDTSDVPQIADIQASLSDLNTGQLFLANKLYDSYRRETAKRAIDRVGMGPNGWIGELTRANAAASGQLPNSGASYIASTITALVMLRADRFTNGSDETKWLDHLAKSVQYSDPTIIRLQALLDSGVIPTQDDAYCFFDRLGECGTPFTNEAFGYLLGITNLFFSTDSGKRAPLLSSDDKRRLSPVWQRFHALLSEIQGAYRGSGLLTSFVAPSAKISRIRMAIA